MLYYIVTLKPGFTGDYKIAKVTLFPTVRICLLVLVSSKMENIHENWDGNMTEIDFNICFFVMMNVLEKILNNNVTVAKHQGRVK